MCLRKWQLSVWGRFLGRHHWRLLSPTPCPQQGHLQQIAQDHTGFEYLQRCDGTTTPGNLFQYLTAPEVKSFFLCLSRISRISVCAHWLFCLHRLPLRRFWPPLLYFPQSGIYMHWCRVLLLPRCRILHFPLFNITSLVSSFQQPFQVPLNGSTSILGISRSSSSWLFAELLCTHSVSSSKSLMKMLSSTGPSIRSRGISLATGPPPAGLCAADLNPFLQWVPRSWSNRYDLTQQRGKSGVAFVFQSREWNSHRDGIFHSQKGLWMSRSVSRRVGPDVTQRLALCKESLEMVDNTLKTAHQRKTGYVGWKPG